MIIICGFSAFVLLVKGIDLILTHLYFFSGDHFTYLNICYNKTSKVGENMQTYETILKRRSVRSFTNEQVSDENIRLLLEAAMAAPSAMNKKPWFFYVVKNEEKLQELRHTHRFTNYHSPLNIVVCGNLKRKLGNRPEDFWIQDCSAAIENILIEAVELGLGTCWCGLYPLKSPVKHLREILDVPEHLVPLGLLHIGYPNEEKEARTQFDELLIEYIK